VLALALIWNSLQFCAKNKRPAQTRWWIAWWAEAKSRASMSASNLALSVRDNRGDGGAFTTSSGFAHKVGNLPEILKASSLRYSIIKRPFWLYGQSLAHLFIWVLRASMMDSGAAWRRS